MYNALCHWPEIHYGTAAAARCLKESPQSPYAESVLTVRVSTSAMPKPGYVYILASKPNGTLYIGVTSDLAKRVHQHREGVVDGFTKRHDVSRLVYYEQHDDIRDAIQREKNLKHWLRRWKLRLIRKHNPRWDDLHETL